MIELWTVCNFFSIYLFFGKHKIAKKIFNNLTFTLLNLSKFITMYVYLKGRPFIKSRYFLLFFTPPSRECDTWSEICYSPPPNGEWRN